jgi:hypothetical protein
MKSFIDSMRVDRAKRSHNCQHNAHHRIAMGDARLAVKVDRTEEKFCKTCALIFLRSDAEKINNLMRELEA